MRMVKRLATTFLMMLMLGLGACSRAVVANPDRALRTRTFDFYWRELEDNYPYFETAGINWDESRARYRDAAVNAPSTVGYYRALNNMLAELDDGHIALRVPQLTQFVPDEDPEQQACLVGTIMVQGKVYITHWPQGGGCVPTQDLGYPELVEISTSPRFTRFSKSLVWVDRSETNLIAGRYADGVTIRQPMTAMPKVSASKRKQWIRYGSTMIRDNMMAGTLLEVPSTSVTQTIHERYDGRRFASETGGGDIHPFWRLDAVDASRRAERASTKGSAVSPWWIDARDLGESVGYIRLSTFSTKDDRGTTSRPIVQRFDAAMKKLRGSGCLVLDLRYNGGGDSTAFTQIAGWFAGQKYTAPVSQYELLFGLIEIILVCRVTPVDEPYTGKVVVLVNRQTASAGELLAAFVKHCLLYTSPSPRD